jgi:hypothetical protein
MGFLGDLGKKALWFVFGLLLLGAGYVFIVKTFLAPPPVAQNASVPPVAAPPAPSSDTPPAPGVSPTPLDASATSPDPAMTPGVSSTPGSSPAAVGGVSQPAIALPDQVALKVPKQLEKGGVTKIYINNDGNDAPEPALYSPSKVIKSEGLGLLTLNKDQFQEVSGYIMAPETGSYNFTVLNYGRVNRLTSLRLKINGVALPAIQGGRIMLDKGWHQVSFFANFGNGYYQLDPSTVRVEWGREGETLKPLDIYREVS